jgi:predicted flap endonuclease-1-like 5' DNA nuclease/cytoskeletal protein CcmA (bactofilin family)
MKQQPHLNRNPFWGSTKMHRMPVVLGALTLAITLALPFGASAAWAQSNALGVPVVPAVPDAPHNLAVTNNLVQPGPVQLGAQSYFDGLDVKAGEAIEGDAVVYKGDARIHAGGRINGGLVVYAGDARVDAGAVVAGDLTAWAGDVVIEGRVEGDVAVLSGDVRLGNAAFVGGDVSSLSGDIDRSDGATVRGDVVRGGPLLEAAGGLRNLDRAQFSAPIAPDAPNAPEVFEASASSRTSGPGWFWRTFLRLLFAGFLSIVLALGSMLIYTLRPQTIARATEELRTNTTRSVAVGITVMGVLSLLTFLLARVFCFAVLSIIPGAASFALGAVGFAVVARTVGNRLAGGRANSAVSQTATDAPSAQRGPVMEVALGGLLVAAVFLTLGALFGGAWGLALLIPVAPGVGAFVNPWLEKYRTRNTPGSTTVAASKPTYPVAPQPPTAPAAPMAPASPAPTSEVAPSTVSAAAAQSVDLTLPEEPQPAAKQQSGLVIDDLVAAADADAAAAAAAKAQADAAREAAEAARVYGGDDFTRISGVGRSWERKLKAAGVLTYGQLASLPVELAAAILGVPPEEIIEDKILQQAANFTANA